MYAYLSQDNLLGSEESPVLVVEIHFLLVAQTWMSHPKILRVSLHFYIEETDGADNSDGDSGNNNNPPVVKIEKCNFAEKGLQIHSTYRVKPVNNII